MNNFEEVDETIMPTVKQWGISCKGVHVAGNVVPWWIVLVVALITVYVYYADNNTEKVLVLPSFNMNESELMGGATVSGVQPELRSMLGMENW